MYPSRPPQLPQAYYPPPRPPQPPVPPRPPYGQYPQPPRPPKKNYKGLAIGLSIMAGLAILGGIGTAIEPDSASNGYDAGTGTATHAAANRAPEADRKPSPSPSPSPKPKVILTRSGSGVFQTDTFITGNHWKLTYSYQCDPDFGIMQIYEYTDGTLSDILVNTSGSNDQATTNVYDAGQHYLEVNAANCSWDIKVIG